MGDHEVACVALELPETELQIQEWFEVSPVDKFMFLPQGSKSERDHSPDDLFEINVFFFVIN